MSDLISREAVNDVIIWHETDGSIAARKALDRIAELPTIPAIPLSVIEVIKADIETEINITLDEHSMRQNDYSDGYVSVLRQALKFIDKHIKEYEA